MCGETRCAPRPGPDGRGINRIWTSRRVRPLSDRVQALEQQTQQVQAAVEQLQAQLKALDARVGGGNVVSDDAIRTRPAPPQ